jgi:hypothetical protein
MPSFGPVMGLQFLNLDSPARQRLINSNGVISIRRKHYDIRFVKECMTRCRSGHGHQCNNLSIETVSFFRLIDCHSRKIITAPSNSEYIALSYVWGEQGKAGDFETFENQTLLNPHKCPKTINDSFRVALDLNIKYLWIDKYCIDQFDDQDKAIQIGQMDSIYANAAVTIIAAAGDGPHHGLPGVDGTLRNKQPSLKIGDHLFASMLRHGADVVSKSKWATRGWTYQEGVLSKHRLIFTDEQVHWECNNTHYAETIDYKPDRVNPARKLSNEIFLDKTPGTEPAEFFSYVAEFRKRTLTYQCDSLNALSGIFRAFEKGESPIYQLAGVPIFYPMRLSTDGQTIMPKTVNQGFLIGLTWQNPTYGCERVPMFPSWSWAGWTGPVYRQSTVDWRGQCFDNSHVWIETDNGELHSFPESQSMKYFFSQLPSNIRYIQIDARTFTCSIRYDLLEGEQKRPTRKPKVLLQVSENYSFRFHLRDADLERGSPQELPPWPKNLTGILIGDTSGNSFEFAAIILKEHDGFYERITCTSFWGLPYVEDEMGLRALYEGGKEILSKWMRNDTVRRTIRLG